MAVISTNLLVMELFIILTGLGASIVTNLLKGLVSRWGSDAVRLLVLAVAAVAAYGWYWYGQEIDWTHWATIASLSVVFYEFVIKRFWK